MSVPLECLMVKKVASHQLVCGHGGVISVLCEAHWLGFREPFLKVKSKVETLPSNGSAFRG